MNWGGTQARVARWLCTLYHNPIGVLSKPFTPNDRPFAMPAAVTLHWPESDIAQIVFDLPGRSTNTLSSACWDDLSAILSELASHPGMVGILLSSGKPGQFLVGADLHEMAGRLERSAEQIQSDCQKHQQVLSRLHQFPVPTLALLAGPCLGGGLELALACDYRWTTPNALLGFPEVKLGLIPGWGGSVYLPRLIGLPTAASMILDAEPISSETALGCGLVDHVVPENLQLAEALIWLRSEGATKLSARRAERTPALEMAPVEREF